MRVLRATHSLEWVDRVTLHLRRAHLGHNREQCLCIAHTVIRACLCPALIHTACHKLIRTLDSLPLWYRFDFIGDVQYLKRVCCASRWQFFLQHKTCFV